MKFRIINAQLRDYQFTLFTISISKCANTHSAAESEPHIWPKVATQRNAKIEHMT